MGREDVALSAVAVQAIELCRSELAEALRVDYMTDKKGRRVRVMHPARTMRGDEQITIWQNIVSAKREHMEMAFGQRRRQIVGDCAQLKADVDSYNDSRPNEMPIQIPFDFTDDLREIEAGQTRAA